MSETPANEMIISGINASPGICIGKAYLVDKGVNSDIIQTFGHGAQQFIGSNKTLEGRRMNRRVEIELSNVKTQ